ncbi:MAG TPA: fatty acid desaturase [Rhizomicrobium sp.]|jgi:omega-6 fatty acid desaturase (delta-12 desaturase)
MDLAPSQQESLPAAGRPAAAAESRSLERGLRILSVHAAFYLATLIGACADLPLGLNILFAGMNGICIALLFIIAHDGAHGSFTPKRSWNRWIARFAFVPCVHSASLWQLTHDEHHRRTNLRGVDRVWTPMSVDEYAAATPFRRFVERVYRGAWGPIFYYFAEFWLWRLVLPVAPDARKDWKRHLPDSLFVLTGFAFTIASICALGAVLAPHRPLWMTLAIAWALPFMLWNYVMAVTIYINHTHPAIPWFRDAETWNFHNGNILSTTHIRLPAQIPLLYAQAMAHTAHHVDRSRPVYALPEAQADLEMRFGRSVVEYPFSIREYRRILSACKLFDFDRMCWTDFSGRPTARTWAAVERNGHSPDLQPC